MGYDPPDPSVLNSRLFASECSNPTAARLQSLECLHGPQETGRQKNARKFLDGPFHKRHLQLGLGRVAVNFCILYESSTAVKDWQSHILPHRGGECHGVRVSKF